MSQRKSTQQQQQQQHSALSKAGIEESAKRQIGEAKDVAFDAVGSGAWVYPLQGIFYMLSHPKLLTPLLPTVIKSILLSVVVLALMFFFTYLPQVAVLAFVSGPLAFIGAVPLVLGETYLVLLFLTKTFLLGQVTVDLFDAVLLSKQHTQLVQKGRILAPASQGGKVTQLGKAITKPISSRVSVDGVVRYVLSLPLNLIPVVGTVFFLGYNGFKAGPGFHSRYFQLKGYDKNKKAEFIHKRRGSYTAFGVVAMALNLVPIVGVFFGLSSAVGAALWASDIENKNPPPTSANLSNIGGGAGTAIKQGGQSLDEEIEVGIEAPEVGFGKADKEGKKKEL